MVKFLSDILIKLRDLEDDHLNHIEAYFEKQSSTIKKSNATLLNILHKNSSSNELHEELLTFNKTKQEIWGQFHTPRIFQDIVLNSLPQNIIEHIVNGKKLIDPSCGIGNFLISIIDKALDYFTKKAENSLNKYHLINKYVIPKLFGAEIDDVMIQATSKFIKERYNNLINCPQLFHIDMLSDQASNQFCNNFDYVIGNPPWVEVKKLPTPQKEFIQKKYSTHNLYSAFIIEALNLINKDGTICFILPRSLTGGTYFSSVRNQLKSQCSIQSIYFISRRNQDFYGGKILQEIIVLCFTKRKLNRKVRCFPLNDVGEETSEYKIKQDEIYADHDNILILAKNEEEFQWVNRILKLKKFKDHGFQFSTGQLVPHRVKNFLRTKEDKNNIPIIYAHNIKISPTDFPKLYNVGKEIKNRPPFAIIEGFKNFDGRKKDTPPKKGNLYKCVNTHKELIIMRRRSHKGDKQRFIGIYSSELPHQYFLDNSVNYIYKSKEIDSTINLRILYLILSSNIFERFFESISSNTQINKNDFYLFGIPVIDKKNSKIISTLEKIDIQNKIEIDTLVEALYE